MNTFLMSIVTVIACGTYGLASENFEDFVARTAKTMESVARLSDVDNVRDFACQSEARVGEDGERKFSDQLSLYRFGEGDEQRWSVSRHVQEIGVFGMPRCVGDCSESGRGEVFGNTAVVETNTRSVTLAINKAGLWAATLTERTSEGDTKETQMICSVY